MKRLPAISVLLALLLVSTACQGAGNQSTQPATGSSTPSAAPSASATALDAEADFERGEAAFLRGDYETAARLYRSAAEHGLVAAQKRLAHLYGGGKGLQRDDRESLKWYKLAAEQGDSEAQFYVGLFYGYGLGVKQDYGEALRWYRLAAERCEPDAASAISSLYQEGWGVPLDQAKSDKWFTLTGDWRVEASNPFFIEYCRQVANAPEGPQEALKSTRAAAEAGDPQAQAILGTLYLKGFRTVLKDDAQAEVWLRRAADKGHAEAQFRLGTLHYRRSNDSKSYLRKTHDYSNEMEWFRKAAEQGHPQAQESLGFMYELGRGVPKDGREASKWYARAYRVDDETVLYGRYRLDAYMSATELAEADRRVEEWYRAQEARWTSDAAIAAASSAPGASAEQDKADRLVRVSTPDALPVAKAAFARGDYAEAARLYWPLAEAGDAEAQAQLGVMYREGLGLPQDDEQALIWSSYAALQNSPTAFVTLGLLTRHRPGMAFGEAEAEALEWFRKAAAQGQPEAQTILGALYEEGEGGLRQDEAEALRWYRLAAEQGHAEAQYRLAELVKDAEGLTRVQAEAEAFKWTRTAAEQGHPRALDELADYYWYGRQVSQDTSEALRLYSRAAEKGNAFASSTLAFVYRNGRSVPKDLVTARMWYRIAAAQDELTTMIGDEAEEIEKEMSPAEIAEAEKRAQDWLAAHPQSLQVSRWDRTRLRTARPTPGEPPDEKMLAAMRLAAELGDPNAQFNLGRMHFTGNGLPQDDIAAARWLGLAAEQGQPRAQSFLGSLYINGRGVAQDMVAGQMWLTIAAAQGDLLGRQISENNAKEMSGKELAEAEKRARDWLAAFEARFAARLASYQTRGRQETQAAKPSAETPSSPAEERAAAWRQAAEAGDIEAQAQLAALYYRGTGGPQSQSEAAKWFRAAAEGGHAKSQLLLGYLLLQGQAVPQDFAEGVKWLRAAADQGLPGAQHSIGQLYAGGEAGLPQDDAEAVKWYRLAAEQDDAEAQGDLGRMYRDGRGVEQDPFTAYVWFNLAGAGLDRLEKVARQLSWEQVAEAQARARTLWEGFEADRDWRHYELPKAAAEMIYGPNAEGTLGNDGADAELQPLRSQAEAGKPDAQTKMAELYRTGENVPKDYQRAALWYREAATQAHVPAMLGLARLYEAGKGVKQSTRTAARWYRRAAELGETTVFYEVGVRYRQNMGLPFDRVLAHVWFSLAVDEGDKSAESLRHWLAREMTPAEIAEAEERAEAWRQTFAKRQDAAE